MATTRRGFMKALLGGFLGGAMAIGAAAVPAMLRTPGTYIKRARAARTASLAARHDWGEHAWTFIVDSTKCIGCGLCVRACKQENYISLHSEFTRTWVERYVYTEDDEVFVDSPEAGIEGFVGVPANIKYDALDIAKSYFVPKLCNQCDNPPCVQVCPVGATYQTAEGVVLVDDTHCIGCRYCIQACPYGARYLNPVTMTADKCTWCYHRVSNGLKPACVEVCPVGARLFGDLNDPDSPLEEVMREHSVSVLKPGLGTEPKVYYVGIDSEVR